MGLVRHGGSLRALALAGPLAALLALFAAASASAQPVYPHRSGVLIAWEPTQWENALAGPTA